MSYNWRRSKIISFEATVRRSSAGSSWILTSRLTNASRTSLLFWEIMESQKCQDLYLSLMGIKGQNNGTAGRPLFFCGFKKNLKRNQTLPIAYNLSWKTYSNFISDHSQITTFGNVHAAEKKPLSLMDLSQLSNLVRIATLLVQRPWFLKQQQWINASVIEEHSTIINN